jgi:exodeoxyribonuclease VII large subunit
MAANFFDFHEEVTSRRAAPGARSRHLASDGAPPPQKPSRETWSVSQLSDIIDSAIQTGLPETVHVHGEVSNVKIHHSSGHMYFTLKDAFACVDCVMWKSDRERQKFDVKDGQEMLVSGYVKVYAERGRYQLYARRIEPTGQGALELAFRRLYAKLDAEGLFDPARKRPLPQFPRNIVLVTSRQGAALQDMLKVLNRYTFLRLRRCHVPVQGEGAAALIAAALRSVSGAAQQEPAPADVIVVARGGGSLEDLWAFNEEVVARAIADSVIPVVTGIGHEVDTTIADLVADYHAHTPTEAAQVIAANWRTARDVLGAAAMRLRRGMLAVVGDARQRLNLVERHEIFRRPLERINLLRQRLDDRSRAIQIATRSMLDRMGRAIELRESRLRVRHPQHELRLNRQRLVQDQYRLTNAARAGLARRAMHLDAMERQLNALSPRTVLARGYSITTVGKRRAVVRSVRDVEVGQKLYTRVADGEIESTAREPGQGELFE